MERAISKITTREATPEEAAFFDSPGYVTRVLLLFDGEQRIGRGCLCYHPELGQMLANRVEVTSENANALIILLKGMRTLARELGHERIFIPVTESTSPPVLEMWTRLGAVEVTRVYEIPI